MARTKLTDKQKKKIVADYIENENFSEVARMNGVNASTVKRLIDSGYDKNLQEKARQKKEENTQSTIEYMQTQHATKKRILDKLLKGIELKAEDIDMFTNIKDLATAYGIILDKELKVLELKNKKAEDEEGLNRVREILVSIKEATDDTNKGS